MFDRLAELEAELEKLEAELPDILASGDRHASRDAGRRHAELKPLVDAVRAYRGVESELAEARELLDAESDADMRAYLLDEIATKEAELGALDARLRDLLVPRDPDEGKNVIVEIRGGEGGEEGNLWAADLFHMYERYADQHRWKLETLSSQPSDMGGFRDVTFVVKGDDAWSHLKHEAGPHRVQRVPTTESQGRVHTSAATVAVLPEAEEIDVAVDPNDLEVDVYRSSGPGGQSVNTTDSAVRITHLPTGIVVSMQNEKSQLQNREAAMRVLRARILARQQEEIAAAASDARKSQIRSMDRSERIRTYNFPENRIADHRTGYKAYNLDTVMNGALEPIVESAIQADEEARLAQLGDE